MENEVNENKAVIDPELSTSKLLPGGSSPVRPHGNEECTETNLDVKEAESFHSPKVHMCVVNEQLERQNDILTNSLPLKSLDDNIQSNNEEFMDDTVQNRIVKDSLPLESLDENVQYNKEEHMDDTNQSSSEVFDFENSDSHVENASCAVEYDFSHIPFQVTGSWKEFKQGSLNNFTKGCKWAPDGSCILTCSDDNNLKLFNLPQQLWDPSQWEDVPEMTSAVTISEGELIYDYCWYPLMNSADPCTCCLVSSSKGSTVHLWDGFTGELRCSYRCYDHMDEIVAARSLGFSADGEKLFCGFEKCIRIFNVDSPGREFEQRQTFAKKSGQSGIISCFAFTPMNRNISAVGSYRKSIGIYSEPNGELECLLEGQRGGITHLQFSSDGQLLFSGGRKDPEILCWDLRNLGQVLFSLRRSCLTNQRMYFDISRCGKYIISGNHNGAVTIWDITKEPKDLNSNEFNVLEPVQFFLAHEDCVNGISIHPSSPFLCSSSGQRKFQDLLSDDEDEMFASKIPKHDNSLRLWWIGKWN